jgi:hypothetical protein
MRKFRLLIGLLSLLTAAATAIAFNHRLPKQDLYYYNVDEACVAAPCVTENRTGKACFVTVYTDANCQTLYDGTVYTSE